MDSKPINVLDNININEEDANVVDDNHVNLIDNINQLDDNTPDSNSFLLIDFRFILIFATTYYNI